MLVSNYTNKQKGQKMMTRKDYVKTAEILNGAIFGTFETTAELVDAFAEMFASDNPNFDRDRFVYAVNKS